MNADAQMLSIQVGRVKRLVDFLITAFETAGEYDRVEVMQKIKTLLDNELV